MQEFVLNISEAINKVTAGVFSIKPELMLSLAFLITVFTGILKKSNLTWWLTFFGILLTGAFHLDQFLNPIDHSIFFGMVLPDRNSACLKLIVSFTCLLFLLFVKYHKPLQYHKKKIDDFLSVLLAMHLGLNLLVMSVNWLMVYIAIEMISIGSYIMVGYLGEKKEQAEAALKYVLFGTVCSAVMLYGLSLLYGYTGGLSFMAHQHVAALNQMPSAALFLIFLLIFTGIGFKLSFVPFHFWTPDVYQGAPTPVAAFLSTAPKIATIALLGKLIFYWNAAAQEGATANLLFYLLSGFGIASMLLGNLAALRQDHVKRMMAYSSIGHTGFLLMIVLTDLNQSFQVLYFYLLIYVIMNMATFMLIDFIEERLQIQQLSQYSGLGKTYPLLMTAMTVLMVSLTGLPPTAGFVAKLLAFSAALSAYTQTGSQVWLLLMVTGAITTVVALFFYIRIPFYAFFRRRKEALPQVGYNGLTTIAIILAFLSVVLGIVPSFVLDWIS